MRTIADRINILYLKGGKAHPASMLQECFDCAEIVHSQGMQIEFSFYDKSSLRLTFREIELE